jgi:hypothetical protein
MMSRMSTFFGSLSYCTAVIKLIWIVQTPGCEHRDFADESSVN